MTPLEFQQKAVDETGGSLQNAQFEFEVVYGTSGGSVTVGVNGLVSSPLTWPPSADQLSAALESLATVGVGGVLVTGAIGGPFQIEFVGANVGQVVPAPTIDGSSLTPPQDVLVVQIQQGATTNYLTRAAQYWDDHSDAANTYLQFLFTKFDLINYRIGQELDETDIRTGQANLVEVAGGSAVARLERMLARTQEKIYLEVAQLQLASRSTFGGVMTKQTPNGLPYGEMPCRFGRFGQRFFPRWWDR